MTDYAARAAELKAILNAAKPGQTIRLVGDYGFPDSAPFRWGPKSTSPRDAEGNILPLGSITDPITIDCTDAIIGALYWGNIAGLNFVGGQWTGQVRIDGGKRLGFDKIISTAGGKALNINGGSDISVTRASFEGGEYGVLLGGVVGGLVEDVTIRGVGIDGVNLALSRNIAIRRLSVKDSRPGPTTHPDGVQGFSRATHRPCSNILIEDSDFEGMTQGLGFFNHKRWYKAGTVLWDGTVLAVDTELDDGGFEDMVFRRNRLNLAYPQGIAVYDGRRITVEDNHLSTYQDAGHRCSINLVRCADVTRSGNIVEAGGGSPAASDAPVVATAPTDAERISTLQADLAASQAATAAAEANAAESKAALDAAMARIEAARTALA